MDILAHTLWTNASARGVNALASKKNKNFKMHVGWTAFFGVAPDFFSFTIPFLILLWQILVGKANFGFPGHHATLAGLDLASYLYQFSHSIVIFILVFVLVGVISGRPRYELFGWLLHILIDIPSHAINFYPTPFLFPISEYRFPYGVSWANPIFMMINYSLLAITWIYIFYKKHKKNKV